MGIGLLLSRGLLVQTVGAALIAGGTTYYSPIRSASSPTCRPTWRSADRT